MQLYEKLINKEEKLSLIGLGYVGMPIAVAFARKLDVIGFDLNSQTVPATPVAGTCFGER